MGKLQRLKPLMKPVLDQLRFEATGVRTEESTGGAGGVVVGTGATSSSGAGQGQAQATMQSTGGKLNHTVPKPFNLTKVRPRLIPQPKAISRVIETKPVPKAMLERTSLA